MIGARRKGIIQYAIASKTDKVELADIFECDEQRIARLEQSYIIWIGSEEIIFRIGDVVVRDIDDELYIYSEDSFHKLYSA